MSGLRRRLVNECRCRRQRFEPLFGDRLTGNLAYAVRSRLDPAQRLVDAAQQFALQGVVLDRLFAVRDRARLVPLIADAAVAASTLQLTESGPDARFNVGAVFEQALAEALDVLRAEHRSILSLGPGAELWSNTPVSCDWLFVDGSSLIFRAFFAMPDTVRSPDGHSV